MVVCHALEQRTLLSAWYVSPHGSDANRGNAAHPFLTIQHAADVAQPGDTVFIRSGVYHEMITPATSGTAAKPITFRPAGRQSVTIDGADPLSGITENSPGIFTAVGSGDLGEGNNDFFLDGVELNEAQWPNTGTNTAATFSPPATATATDASVQPAVNGVATATLTVPSLQDPANAWVGATIHVAPGQGWVFQTGTVVASSPGSITYTYVPLAPYASQTPEAGNQFYLTGSLTAFNDGGEWFYDSTTNQFSFRDPGTAAAPAVEMKHRLYAFDLSGRSFIRIQNINLFACTINTDANSSNISLTGLNARYVSRQLNLPDPWADQYSPHTTGIILNGSNNIIANSTIAFSSGDGIFLGGSGNIAQNNVIHDVDMAGGDEAGVSSLGSSNQVLNNTIYNCGRSGVVIRHSPQISVLNNRIYNCGLQTADVGGIYTFGTDGQGSRIAYNIISGIHTGSFGGVGLYLDNGSSNYILDHNITWDVDYASRVNDPTGGIQFYNNTLLAVTSGLSTSATDMTGDVFINNIYNSAPDFVAGADEANNLLPPTDPMFLNAAENDYRLAKTSPAIDAGQVVAPYTNGFKGNAPDLGALEFKTKAFVAGARLKSVK